MKPFACARSRMAENALPAQLPAYPSLRILAAAALLAVAVAVTGILWRSEPSPATHPEITVVYVGADDCAPCQAWHRVDRPQFLSSPEFSRLTYREITSPKLIDLRKNGHWPEALRKLRDAFDQMPGVPSWFVIEDDNILLTARGLGEWNKVAFPRIKSLVR